MSSTSQSFWFGDLNFSYVGTDISSLSFTDRLQTRLYWA
jgi:hypothetical protein